MTACGECSGSAWTLRGEISLRLRISHHHLTIIPPLIDCGPTIFEQRVLVEYVSFLALFVTVFLFCCGCFSLFCENIVALGFIPSLFLGSSLQKLTISIAFPVSVCPSSDLSSHEVTESRKTAQAGHFISALRTTCI